MPLVMEKVFCFVRNTFLIFGNFYYLKCLIKIIIACSQFNIQYGFFNFEYFLICLCSTSNHDYFWFWNIFSILETEQLEPALKLSDEVGKI